MKLKKIASLALAGVMAVSMLTACGSNAIDEKPPVDDGDNDATSYSAVLQDELESKNIMKVKFSDSSELDSALESAVAHAGFDAVTNDFIHSLFGNGYSIRWVDQNTSSDAVENVNNKLREVMKPEIGMQKTASETVRWLSPEAIGNPHNPGADCDENNINTTILFVADRGMGLEAAMDEIADMIADGVVGLNTSYDSRDVNGATYNYEYTGSVSVCAKNFDAMNGIGVNFIAVNIVRTIVY